MSYYVYILYSPGLDRYYVGQTEDPEKRLEEHNTGFYSGSFTSRATDWEYYLKIVCPTRHSAIKVERHIKAMRNRRYIEMLKRKPEKIELLVFQFNS